MATHELNTQYYPRPQTPQPQPAATPTDEIYIPAPAPRRQRRLPRRALLLGVLLTVLLASLTAVAGGGVLLYYSNLIAPGAQVLGNDVGGQTQAAATEAIAAQWQRQSITLASGETTWLVHPSALGITLDAAATARSAHAQSRTTAALSQLVRGGAFPVQPAWQIEMPVAEAFLHTKAAELAVPPQDAHIEIVNGQVREITAVPGRALDVAATTDWLMRNGAAVVRNGRLDLIDTAVAPAVTDVSAQAAQARRLLTTSVAVRAYDPIRDEAVTWQVDPAVWGDWLSPSPDGAQPDGFAWTLESARAEAFFAARSEALGNGRFVDGAAAVQAVAAAIEAGETAVTLRVYHPDRQYVVQPGETIASIGRDAGIPYPWIQQANSGLGDGLSVGQTITIPSPDNLIPLPVVENKRVIVSIGRQRVWVYEDGAVKWEWAASTGIDSSPTAPGIFQVQSHEPNAYAGNWDLWMPSFMGIYRPVPTSDFMNGFHGFPTRDGANLLWTNNLGTPVTYGCILLSNEHAAQLYAWAEEGVIVEIRP